MNENVQPSIGQAYEAACSMIKAIPRDFPAHVIQKIHRDSPVIRRMLRDHYDPLKTPFEVQMRNWVKYWEPRSADLPIPDDVLTSCPERRYGFQRLVVREQFYFSSSLVLPKSTHRFRYVKPCFNPMLKDIKISQDRGPGCRWRSFWVKDDEVDNLVPLSSVKDFDKEREKMISVIEYLTLLDQRAYIVPSGLKNCDVVCGATFMDDPRYVCVCSLTAGSQAVWVRPVLLEDVRNSDNVFVKEISD